MAVLRLKKPLEYFAIVPHVPWTHSHPLDNDSRNVCWISSCQLGLLVLSHTFGFVVYVICGM